MTHDFDPGYGDEPFRTLCGEYPGPEAYPSRQFRLEWGPIFHRGRLDGSARVLVLGQDPAQHETILRRVLVGEAGRRVQGFLAKLGILRSYVILNTYLYSVYGSVRASTRRGAALVAYRNQWLDAALAGGKVEGVLALGTAADEAWQMYRTTATGSALQIAYAAVKHPTQPESSAKGDKAKLAAATAKLLENWNVALDVLMPAVEHPDVATPLVHYGQAWAEGDRQPIPAFDIPPGLPAWTYENDGWAARKGTTDEKKRRNITITVPKGVIPAA